MELLLCLLLLARLLPQVAGVVVQDLEELRTALNDEAVDQVEVVFSVVDLCRPTCSGITVTHSVDIAALVPSTWILQREATVAVATNVSLTVSGFILNVRDGGGDPIVPDAWSVAPGASLRLLGVTLVSAQQSALTDIAPPAGSLEGSFQRGDGDEGNSHVWYSDSIFIYDDTGCYTSGVPLYDKRSFLQALRDESSSELAIVRNLLITRKEFPTSGVESASSMVLNRGKHLRIRGCSGVRLDVDLLDRAVFLRAGSSLLLEGDFQVANVLPSLADDWGMSNYAYTGFFSVSPNASAIARDITILGGEDNPLFDEGFVEELEDGVRPNVQRVTPSRVVVNHNRTRAAWDAFAHNVTSFDRGYWLLDNVTVMGSSQRSMCNQGLFPAQYVDSGSRLLAALQDLEIFAIRIANDIRIDRADGWPTPDVPSEGINITRPLTVFSCNPVTVDTADLYQMVYVGTGGYLKVSGPITFTRAHAAPRRGFNAVFLGILSVEDHGIIEVKGATIVGLVPGFTNTENHPFRVSATKALLPKGQELERINATHSRLVNWRVVVSDWVKVSRGIDTGLRGYWHFVNVVETWQEEPQAGAGVPMLNMSALDAGGDSGGDGDSSKTSSGLVAGTVFAAVALLAAAVLLVWWRKRAVGAAAARAAAEEPEAQPRGPDSKPSASFSVSKTASHHHAGEKIIETKRAMLGYHGADINEDNIELDYMLGQGSYGKVYKGKWRGTEVAIKTLVLPHSMTGQEKLEKMVVMETAISSSLSHPNIVQTFSFAIRPIMDSSAPSCLQQPNLEGSRLMQLFGTDAGDSSGMDTSHASERQEMTRVHRWELLLILEYCDRGSLRAALNNGDFTLPDNTKDMELITRTAMGVARAMLHLHSENVVHSDLKARNVLLQSYGADQFTTKVSDFGLSVRMDADQTHISDVYQGTLTHMAPEVLMEGRISKAADVYAYGILLWELYTAGHAFKGTPQALLGHQVTQQGLRPEFPSACPYQYQQLACSCWDADPKVRPTFKFILEALACMRGELNIRPMPSQQMGGRDSAATASSILAHSHQASDATSPVVEETLSVDATELQLGSTGLTGDGSLANPVIWRETQ